MKKILETCQVLGGITLSIFSCFPAEAATFNVLGTETINTIELQFLIFDTTGTALPTRRWNSNNDKYQDEKTDKFLSLQYWNVTFSYDATQTSVQLSAFHKVDPHTSMPGNGGTFNWNVQRPAATNPIGNTGALRGTASVQDIQEHVDTQGQHSDRYTAIVAYTVNRRDLETNNRIDEIGVSLNGEHCAEPKPPSPENRISTSQVCTVCGTCKVPEPSTTSSFLALGTLGAGSALRRKLNQKLTEKETTKVG